MYKSFTTNDLILYYFNEVELTDTVLIQQDIDNNSETEENYQEIVQVMDHIDQCLLNPSESVIKNILNYSQSLKQF